jgi:hypothetical protein
MKYLVLFIGGSIPEGKRAQSITDRLAWMNGLRDQGKLIDGSPLNPHGKTITDSVESDYTHDAASTNGYAIIEAEDLDEAVELTRPAPQLKSEYGAARAEIRPLQQIQ